MHLMLARGSPQLREWRLRFRSSLTNLLPEQLNQTMGLRQPVLCGPLHKKTVHVAKQQHRSG